MNIIIMVYYRRIGSSGYFMLSILSIGIIMISNVFNSRMFYKLYLSMLYDNFLMCFSVVFSLSSLGMVFIVSMICFCINIYVMYYLGSNNVINVYLN